MKTWNTQLPPSLIDSRFVLVWFRKTRDHEDTQYPIDLIFWHDLASG